MTETLVLIPGFANDGHAWKYSIEHLKETFDVRIHVMDKFSTRQEMTLHLLKHTPDRFILAGHSMGGWIAQAAAAIGKERITKLLLLNTWATLSPQMIQRQKEISEALKQGRTAEMMQQYLPLLVHPSRLQDHSLIESIQSMVSNFPIPILIKQIEAMVTDSSSLRYHPLITAPTLILHSRQDALFPNEYEVLLSGIKNSELAIVEECGHASLIEKPEEVTRILLSFTEK